MLAQETKIRTSLLTLIITH